jgi:hypothetical protein
MGDVRPDHDLDAEQQNWQAWIDGVCADLDVPADLVDVAAIHDLSRQVAHGLARPLAPVSTFILGLALGLALGEAGSSPVPADLSARLAARITDHV